MEQICKKVAENGSRSMWSWEEAFPMAESEYVFSVYGGSGTWSCTRTDASSHTRDMDVQRYPSEVERRSEQRSSY